MIAKNKNIAIAIILNIVITVSEVIVGLLIGSLALVSDAIHNFSDVGALALSWWGEKVKEKESTKVKTFGYKRAEILIAFFNSLVLLAVVIFIFIEAIERVFHPSGITGIWMIITAAIALTGNGIATYLLEKDAHKNLNLKSAWLHSLQDALFSFGVLVGAVMIYFFQWNIVDPIISIVLSVYILKEVYVLLKESLDILMESVPADIDFEKVKEALEEFPDVKQANDIHIWQTDSNSRFISAHLEIDDIKNEKRNELLSAVQKNLLEKFNINHSTLQIVSTTEAERLKFSCNHCN